MNLKIFSIAILLSFTNCQDKELSYGLLYSEILNVSIENYLSTYKIDNKNHNVSVQKKLLEFSKEQLGELVYQNIVPYEIIDIEYLEESNIELIDSFFNVVYVFEGDSEYDIHDIRSINNTHKSISTFLLSKPVKLNDDKILISVFYSPAKSEFYICKKGSIREWEIELLKRFEK